MPRQPSKILDSAQAKVDKAAKKKAIAEAKTELKEAVAGRRQAEKDLKAAIKRFEKADTALAKLQK